VSRRDSIVDDIVTALGAASHVTSTGVTVTKPTGLVVDRQRPTPIDIAAGPAMAVYQIQETVETPGRNRLAKRKLQVCVECRIDAGATSADQALDAYSRWSTLAVLNDPRRATLAHDTTELGTEWEQQTANTRLASFRQVFLIEYVTSASDIDAATAG
jgi:hypothetical protein